MEVVGDVKPDIAESIVNNRDLTDENNSGGGGGQSGRNQDQGGGNEKTSANNNTIKILTQTLQSKGNPVTGIGGGTVYVTGGTNFTTASPVRTSSILSTTTLVQQPTTMAMSSAKAQGLSIVVTLPQSVIQSPSVIQSASGQIQLGKGNVILLSNPPVGIKTSGVIQTTGGALQAVQLLESHNLHSDESLSNDGVDNPRGADRKRRDILTRRPSYRKILNDLGGAEITGDRGDSSATSESSQDGLEGGGNILIGGQQYPQSVVKVISANTLGLSGATTAEGATSLQTITMTNAGTGGTIVQYSHPDGQPFYVPVGGELQTYTIRPVSSSASSSPSVVVHGGSGGHHVPEEATRKREIRLLKNREAARECRRKKKEYIKCLENRVAVLENQNKALIDELKSLKELYCQHKVE